VDFVLVHGSYHGGWCWDFLVPELERLGHRSIALDLPISKPNAGARDYADAVVAAAAGLDEPIVVGHSMGGLVIPLVPAARPVRRLIFLAAFLPLPGTSTNDQRASEPIDGTTPPTTAEWTSLGDDVWMVGPNTAREVFFHDALPETAAWAVARLRPQAYHVMGEPSPLQQWPDVPVDVIVCRDDRAINPDWVRASARERLGVEAVEIDGSHSPFLTRPVELARLLDSLVAG
jgi:pimeloyl-ACP methyl ester carboxylesterase